MGTDTPLAVLSEQPQLLFDYFKQLFAQVTNPPLDAIREELVTSLDTTSAARGTCSDETPEPCHLIKLKLPDPRQRRAGEAAADRHDDAEGFRSTTLPMLFDAREGGAGARAGAGRAAASRRARRSTTAHTILILSDRGVDARRARRSRACSRRPPCTTT